MNALPDMLVPYTGVEVTTFGHLRVYYLGSMIALVDPKSGAVYMQRWPPLPIFIVEYIIHLPRPEDTRWN